MHVDTENLLTIGQAPSSDLSILLTPDEAYAPYAAVTLASLFKHATTAMDVTILTPGFSPETLQRYERIEQQMSHSLTILKVHPSVTAGFGSEYYWPNAAYLRLAAAELLSHDRILYLDSDLLIRAPLQQLFAIDLGEHLVAGVPEFSAELMEQTPGLNWLGLPPGDVYLNAGVVLMDLDGLRRERFSQRALEMQESAGSKFRFADQCLLNAALVGRKAELDPRWNIRGYALPASAFHYLLTTGTRGIFHFNGPQKPWTDGADPALREVWGEYLKLTGYTMDEVCRPAPPVFEKMNRDLSEIRALVNAARRF